MLTPEPGLAYLVCMGGKRHGPPGDCGGIPGHYYLLDAISDPDHDQHEELLEWLRERPAVVKFQRSTQARLIAAPPHRPKFLALSRHKRTEPTWCHVSPLLRSLAIELVTWKFARLWLGV